MLSLLPGSPVKKLLKPVQLVSSPAQSVVKRAGDTLSDFWSAITDGIAIREENEALKAQIADLRYQLTQNEEAALRYEELKDALHMGSFKITTGVAQAFLGKAQVFNKDWEGAKESLKAVIKSDKYALVPSDRIWELFHVDGDGCEEKVLDMNYVYNESFGKYGGGKFHYQRNQALFLRMFKAYPDVLIKEEGWGNNCAVTKKFADAIMAHEPNSYRRKAWVATYEELLTEYPYTNFRGKNLDVNADGTPKTKEEKLMDPKRGLDFNKYEELYANYGYFFMKFMPWAKDLIPNNSTVTEENRIVMRYAEVLLLYAEACAMTNDNDGLQYLNKVAERAGAPTYSELTMLGDKRQP